MTTSWKLVLAVFLVALITLLCVLSYMAGLAVTSPETSAEVVELPNGQDVMCVHTERGGVSCDWDGWMSE